MNLQERWQEMSPEEHLEHALPIWQRRTPKVYKIHRKKKAVAKSRNKK